MRVLRWRSTGLGTLGRRAPGRGTLLVSGQLREAVGGAHVTGGPSTVPLQGQLQEPFTQGAHVPMPQLPQGFILSSIASRGATGIPVTNMWPQPRLLGPIVL